MLKIYTRTGDKGETSLYGGRRVAKHNLQVVAYGTVDELNSAIGIVIASVENNSDLTEFLTTIQKDLFVIGAHLSGNNQSLSLVGKRVKEMERFIDKLTAKLTPLKNFILPGGVGSASFAHLARSICRRAEREVIRLSKEVPIDRRVIMYLNRLSDLLFVIARYLNKQSDIVDVIWKGK